MNSIEIQYDILMKMLTPILHRAIRQGQLQDLRKLKQILEKN